ncbi:hypothetical protein Tco_0825736 [Tanacetum coccineum]
MIPMTLRLVFLPPWQVLKYNLGEIRFKIKGEALRAGEEDSIATQTCELSKEEFNDFLTLYPIPSEYHVILPKSNQTIFDAPPGFIYLGLTLLVVPSSPLLLSCAKPIVVRPLPRVITHIEAWHERFFYVQDSIIPAKYTQLLSNQNKLDSKSFKDKLPLNIEENPMFQRLGRYPTSVHVFPDPILFLAGLKPSWEYGRQRPTIMEGGKEMAFRNFIYTEDDEDLSFLPKEPSSGFGTGSQSVLINMEPLKADEELVIQPAEVTAHSRESPKPELFVVHPGSVAAWIKDRKYKTREGSSRPLVKRKLALGSSISHAKTSSSKDDVPYLTVSDDDEGRLSFFNLLGIVFASWVHQYVCLLSFFGLPDVLELKDATACHLKIFFITPPSWKNHLDIHMDAELLDLHDRCYARQAVVDNAVNRRSHELLQVIKKLRGEFDVMKDRERAREEECEELRAKCEAASSPKCEAASSPKCEAALSPIKLYCGMIDPFVVVPTQLILIVSSSIEATSLLSFLFVTSFVLPLSSLATLLSTVGIMASKPVRALAFYPCTVSGSMAIAQDFSPPLGPLVMGPRMLTPQLLNGHGHIPAAIAPRFLSALSSP